MLRQRQFSESHLAAVRPLAGRPLKQLLHRLIRLAEWLDNPPRFAIDRFRLAGPGVEHHDANRRGIDQRLEVGAGALLVPVGAGVHDGRRRLRCEQQQDFFVLVREVQPALLLGQEESAQMCLPVTEWSPLKRPVQKGIRGDSQRAEVGGEIAQPHRPGQVPEVLEEPWPFRPVQQLPVLFRREAGGDEVPGLTRVVDGRDEAVAGTGQGPGRLDDFLKDGAEIEACVDPLEGPAERREALLQRVDPS